MPAPVPASEPFVEPHSPPQSGTGDVPGEAESGAEHTRRLDDDSADHAHDAYEDEDDEHDRENEDLKKNKGTQLLDALVGSFTFRVTGAWVTSAGYQRA